MPVSTNLNVSPYFDDFQADDDFAKVLFKPGYPVQARELTTLQSILQNQIEKFGKHFFKEGAKVIPGNIGYNQLYYGVQLNNNYQGVPVEAYIDQIVGATITGVQSGVTAVVDRVLLPSASERGQLTLYIQYVGSNSSNNTSQEFLDGEGIFSDITILSGLLGNTTIEAGTPFATTFPANASIVGSSFQIEDGVYFFHGQFVTVQRETIILDQYTNKSNYRVGLFVTEEIVNADVDPSLNDNSQGFNNYAAPGADRLKITAGLFKKRLGDFVDDGGGAPTPTPSPVLPPTVDADTTSPVAVQNQGGFGGGGFGGGGGGTGDITNITNVQNVTNVTEVTNVNNTNISNVNIVQETTNIVNNVTNIINAPAQGGGYFVELAQVKNGNLTSVQKPADDYSNNFLEILARRTYAESGDYYVKPFTVTMKNSLNDGMGSRGVYNINQITQGGSTPSEGLALYQVSPGKAFVRGWEIETINSSFLDCNKPRTTKSITNQQIEYHTGPTLVVNNVFRSPTIGVGNTYYLSLRDARLGSDKNTAPGKEVGVARIYDMRLESGSYSLTNGAVNQWDVSLYDVQNTTEIALNTAATLTVPTRVTGQNSGATAFLRSAVSAGTAMTCYEVQGTFINNESLRFDTDKEINRIAVAVTEYSLNDVESVYATNNGVSGINTFSADVVPNKLLNIGIGTISPKSGASGISTIISPNNIFPSNTLIRKDALIEYNSPLVPNLPTRSRIVSVGSSHITVEEITSVTGVSNGALPSAQLDISNIKIVGGSIAQRQSDNNLFTVLPKMHNATVDLTDSFIVIRKTYEVDITNNQFTAQVQSGLNETFMPFDDERYTLIRSDGTTEVLTSDKMSLTGGGTLLQFFDLGSDDTGAQLVVTLKKIKPVAKKKILNRVNSIVVDKSNNGASGIGTTTANDGLTFGNYPFGTKVQDEEISLNYPDVVKIHGIYESADTNDASCPTIILTAIKSLSTTTAEMIIGEKITGQTSGAIGIIAEKITDLKIGYINKNGLEFTEGETIIASESQVEAVTLTLTEPSFDVMDSFDMALGQESTFYDYAKIIRKNTTEVPDRKLKVYFESAYFESTDSGDIITVDSYDSYNYKEIPVVNGHRASDILDIRPRVQNYAVSEAARSPLEFFGRNFKVDGQNVPNILAADEALQINYSYYLGRIDRLFINKMGEFIVKYGDPSEKPQPPEPVDDALEVCKITLPPYLFSIDAAVLKFNTHKRFRMKDIKKLEDRIKSLEYYTTLSMLEVNTMNMFVPDAEGLNKFKSGLFVDNFTTFLTQEYVAGGIKNSIDRERKEMRPQHFTTSVDMIFGPVTNNLQNTQDLDSITIEGNNVRKEADICMLDYTEVEYINQAFATRSESVTPFLISFWQGTIELTPATDTWMDQVRLEPKVTEQEGNFAATMKRAEEQFDVDPQTGMGPTIWGAWEENWLGTKMEVVKTTESTETEGLLTGTWNGWQFTNGVGPWGSSRKVRGELTTTTTRHTTEEEVAFGMKSAQGQSTTVTEQWDTINVGDRIVSRDLAAYMRSRNIRFSAARMKPKTRLYAFLDGVDVTAYCIPKLVEISMDSGVFQVGERIHGYTGFGYGTTSNEKFFARVASINHKEGPFNSPTETYSTNPYNNQPMSNGYSSTSTILNIDMYSLADISQSQFYGLLVANGMKLHGMSSGANATVTDKRLITDISADCQGSLFIPDYNHNRSYPKFETGTKVFTLVNDAENNQNSASTIAEEPYTASGTIENVQEQIISVRNARIEHKQEFKQEYIEKTTGLQITNSEVVDQTVDPNGIIGWYDPLAQSFLVNEPSGVFVTSCDIFFQSKDDHDVPMVFQLRTMDNGVPTSHILPFSEIVVKPNQITTSADGSVATNIKFKAPVFLEGNKEYVMALASNSTKYSVYISRVGETDILTQSFISNQPYLGSLFKSQNASTWEPSQWEDLKFTLYRADFLESGSVELYNPSLGIGNAQIPNLMRDSLNVTSREVRVGLGTTVADTSLMLGRKISQDASGSEIATGYLAGVAGAADGSLSVSNAGIGYTPSDGSRTVTGVNMVTIVGSGRGAVGTVVIQSGEVSSATITSGGSGYVVGDVVGFTTLGVNSVGRDARLSIVSIGMTSELVVNDVQGAFSVGSAKTMMLTNAAGNINQLNAGYGGDVQVSSVTEVTDGLHITVDHKNHGMYFEDNSVDISRVDSDIKPTRLSTDILTTTTDNLVVDDSSIFENFEGVGIGTTNFGYLRIGDCKDGEVVSYTTVSGGSIGISTRNMNGVGLHAWDTGTPVYKYENSGVNLMRINKLHSLGDSDLTDSIGFDHYTLKVDMTANGTTRDGTGGWGKRYLSSTKSTGGKQIHATQNIPFETITPMVQNLTVRGTTVTGELRTTTAQSMSGSEIPWIDNGYEPVALNDANYMDTPRVIGSQVNENLKLNNVPGNKSMNLRLFLNTTNTMLSPMIDAQRTTVICSSNRVNSEITNFATDNRTSTINGDPTACQYISKEIQLSNAATSLKIMVNAYVNEYADIRAFYYISNDQGLDPIFTPFPGYKNLDANTAAVINPKDNNGQEDVKMEKSNRYGYVPSELQYREYGFTVEDLPQYSNYRIKLVLTSTNQVYVPRMKDLRVMALA